MVPIFLLEQCLPMRGIETFLCNENKRCDVERVLGRVGSDIDLIVDDAFHHYKIQTLLAKMVIPLVDKVLPM
jgi:hypothetical protein